MTLLPEVRSQLYDAAGRRARSPGRGLLGWLSRANLNGHWPRTPLIAFGVGLVLVGGAFGAGLIELGAPAKLPFSLYGNAQEGSGGLVPGTVRMLPIAAPDPAGGPNWGMRVLSTTRGEGCLQLGRIVDGKLGALGQDGAFANDGRFHELPVSAAFGVNTCALLDGKGRLFTNITADERAASAWIGVGGRLGGCVPPSAGPYEKGLRLTRQEREHGAKPAAICAQADLRNIYYGLLGPQAQSITYVLDGQRHTLPTVGADGAYMFVTLGVGPSAAELRQRRHCRHRPRRRADQGNPLPRRLHLPSHQQELDRRRRRLHTGAVRACRLRPRRQSAERRRARHPDPRTREPRASRPLRDHDQLHRARAGHRRRSRLQHQVARTRHGPGRLRRH